MAVGKIQAKKAASGKNTAKRAAAKKNAGKKSEVKKTSTVKVTLKKTNTPKPEVAAKKPSAVSEKTKDYKSDKYASFLSGNARFFNRELSWIEFDERILHEARDTKNPLLERLGLGTLTHTAVRKTAHVFEFTVLATLLSGRYIEIPMLPLSFAEL